MKFIPCLTVLLLAPSALADELTLKDGKTIEFRILKDAGDSVEIQTTDNKNITVAKKDIKEVLLVTPKALLTGATFSGDETKGGKPVNLLALVSPKEHGVLGEWRIAGGALVGGGTAGGGLLEVPHIPVGSYDVDLVVERKDGKNEISVGLVAEGKTFSMVFDWGNGECNGLSVVDGRRVYENETRINGVVIPARKAVRICCAVRPGAIIILVDGKEYLRWKGEAKRLSHPNRTDKQQNLFLGTYQTTISVSRYTITPRN